LQDQVKIRAAQAGSIRGIPAAFWWFVVLVVLKQILLVAAVDPDFSWVGGRLLSITLASGGLALFVAAPAFLARGRRQAVALFGVSSLLTLVAYGHLLYFRQYQILPTMDSLRYIDQLLTVRGSVAALVRASDLWIGLDLAVLAAFVLIAPLGARLRPMALRQAGAWCGIGLLVFTAVMLPFAPRVYRPWRGAVHMASKLGFPGYHYHNALTNLLRQATAEEITPALREDAIARIEDAAREPRPALFGAARGHNLIILQVESLQGFAMGLQTPAGAVTPVLDALARESIVFPEFFHQAAAGNTSDAQFAANCSLLPPGDRPAAFEYADRELGCLPRVLAGHGYRTHSFQTLEPDFWNAAAIERAMGFGRSYSENDFILDEKIGMGLSDASKLRQMLEKLTALEEPYHALIYTTSSHSPFQLRGHATLDVGELDDDLEGRYLQAIHYTDRAIGQFLEGLRERGILDRSLLVIYGDHHGLNRRNAQLEHFLPFPADAERAWFAEERRVPLLIRLPHGASAGVRPELGAQVDLPPTLLGLLGIPRAGSPMLGRDLLGPDPENPVAIFADGSALTLDRLWSVAAGGRCYTREAEVATETCADLRALAGMEGDLSRALADAETLEQLRESWHRRHGSTGIQAMSKIPPPE
jgi:phosphoglycerol transferase MdoB-like AlkP superfamily enzyme